MTQLKSDLISKFELKFIAQSSFLNYNGSELYSRYLTSSKSHFGIFSLNDLDFVFSTEIFDNDYYGVANKSVLEDMDSATVFFDSLIEKEKKTFDEMPDSRKFTVNIGHEL